MFYHAVHLLNHPTVAQAGQMGLHGAQVCALAGRRDAGVICTCSTRALSCPEPTIVGTTKGLHVPLPPLGNKDSSHKFQAEHPNFAYRNLAPNSGSYKPVKCDTISSLVAAGLPGCP
mmetsp:Transcript_33013/g.77880  ORF Transcript_33013/g.77880 Transcript_33013/m.77880 type:complete len:117 (+) Transcript_33013:149-499(+)